MDSIDLKTIQDIKNYVLFLDTPDNIIYQENSLLIMSCFAKAIELIEDNSKFRAFSVIDSCEHSLIDARNEIIKSGYMCVKCYALFRAHDH